jgi:hypothetical protein
MATDHSPHRNTGFSRCRLALLLLASADVLAQPQPADTDAAQTPERAAFFGDLHLHTGLSFDAAASGTLTSLDDAYRYALGEPVQYLGRTVQRNRPLDFLAITDHAEYMGIALDAADPNGPFAGTEWPARLAAVAEDTLGFMSIFSASGFRGAAPPIAEFSSPALISSTWQRVTLAAERFYRPEQFTTFVAFEWSPMPGGAHLHRNVIFRGPSYPTQPFSALDSQRPEDLWTYAEDLRAQDIDSVLIPHNPNMSQGLMFAASDSFGDPITRAYAERRLANERLVEITQNKGTSETRPEFGAPDEFAGFELLTLAAERGADPAGGYVRQALARGLEIEAATGVNPFQFGLIGSSDFHSGVSGTEEENFSGALGRSDDIADADAVLNDINPVAGAPSAIFSAGALTGLWAERNTREALFAAMQRREAFATSGTRMRVRLFAGWNFDDDFIERPDWVQQAYRDGYPMGADIPVRAAGDQAPLQLVLHAVKDPDGANLDRIQVIKIWRENGAPREKVIDVAWSGQREVDTASGTLPAVGNTVDLATATYTNSIGAAELATVWTDPEYDPSVPAIYYARVLEIPTPRWSTYLAVRSGLPLTDSVPASIQERAWTSPVFYSP